jgi:flagellar protein FliS
MHSETSKPSNKDVIAEGIAALSAQLASGNSAALTAYLGAVTAKAVAVDLVVALYDGIIRFLHAAGAAVDRGDQAARRAAAKRALDIIIHLQARLRMDVGGRPAQALSEFYASIFAQILQASQSASKQKFDHTIACVKNVRDAWRENQ